MAFDKISRLIFPPRCMFCREFINSGSICASCQWLYDREPHAVFLPDGAQCRYALDYSAPVRRAILGFKFRHRIQYARPLAAYLEPIVEYYTSRRIDCVTWVPTYFYRRWKRGYNQCRLLAKYSVGDKCPVTGLLHRHGFRPSQTSVRNRAENVRNSMKVRKYRDIQGKTVLIIDDIVTSGATLAECRRALLEAGAAEVYCAALAHHERFKDSTARA